MKKPLIGVVPLVDAGRKSYWMLPGYMKGLEEAGGIPVMLPLTSDQETLAQLTDMLDGILFTGGQDVSPSIYLAPRSERCGERCLERDEMELGLLRLALKQDKPVLGICRGIQLINAALGGDLYQDLPTEHPSEIEHHQAPPYDCPIHTVTLVSDTPLQKLLNKDILSVNSYHHQAVKTLAPVLCPMAFAKDGIVEAAWLPTARFVWAVQWHPEFLYRVDPDSMKLFSFFVNQG